MHVVAVDAVALDTVIACGLVQLDRLWLHVAGLQPHLADVRLALQAGALVEKTVQVEQALGEGLRVMRIGMDDLIAVFRRRGGRGRRGGRSAGRREAGREQSYRALPPDHRIDHMPGGRYDLVAGSKRCQRPCPILRLAAVRLRNTGIEHS